MIANSVLAIEIDAMDTSHSRWKISKIILLLLVQVPCAARLDTKRVVFLSDSNK